MKPYTLGRYLYPLYRAKSFFFCILWRAYGHNVWNDCPSDFAAASPPCAPHFSLSPLPQNGYSEFASAISAGANNVPRQMGDAVRAGWLLDRSSDGRGRGQQGVLYHPQTRTHRSPRPYRLIITLFVPNVSDVLVSVLCYFDYFRSHQFF